MRAHTHTCIHKARVIRGARIRVPGRRGGLNIRGASHPLLPHAKPFTRRGRGDSRQAGAARVVDHDAKGVLWRVGESMKRIQRQQAHLGIVA